MASVSEAEAEAYQRTYLNLLDGLAATAAAPLHRLPATSRWRLFQAAAASPTASTAPPPCTIRHTVS